MTMEDATTPMVRFAGAGPVRSLVNDGLKAAARFGPRRRSPANPVTVQARQLAKLLRKARDTRFGRDHRFEAILRASQGSADRLVSAYQQSVPLRTYEQLWSEYLGPAYPVFQDLTWPGKIPYLALTSGTTQGTTKYIPISREMLVSNRSAAWTLVQDHLADRPDSRLFQGKMFFLGGSTALEEPAPGVKQGDLSAIASLEVSPLLRPYTFPPLDLALESDWDRKLDQLAHRSLSEPITLISGVPSWMLLLFQRLLAISGKRTVAEVWPMLEVVVHGGLKFDPYRASFQRLIGSDQVRLFETYPCSEGFIALEDLASHQLRFKDNHGLFYEFVPADALDEPNPPRYWLGNAELGVNYAIVVSTCSGLWSHIIGDTVRLESRNPPLLQFTGRTKYTLSAFGEHLISEEVEAAIAQASEVTGALVREWHVGPVFDGELGYHRYIVEFLTPPDDLENFRQALDDELCNRNADYDAHRSEGAGMPMPALVEARAGAFDDWMRSRGRFGGQNKVPRMDNSGELTADLYQALQRSGAIVREHSPETDSHRTASADV